jgi:hypothetical protein
LKFDECIQSPQSGVDSGTPESKEENMNAICRNCGSAESQIVDDARSLGLLKELQRGIYTCCQIVVWADEQWLAWVEAAEEDGKAVDDVTRPLESAEGETVIVPVRRPPDSRLGNAFDFR